MILEAIVLSLPMSVGVALSPLPVAVVVIMLITSKARVNAPSFLLGWVIGILTVGILVILAPGIHTPQDQPTELSGIIRIILGFLFLFLAFQQWRKRPKLGEKVPTPKLLTHLDAVGAVQSIVTGFLLSAVIPKNLVLCAAGAATIDLTLSNRIDELIALLVFTLIASLTIAAPVAGYFLVTAKADAMFDRWKNWLIAHNAKMLIVMLLLFGLMLVVRGTWIVTG